MTYIDLLIDLHLGTDRQGPGSEEDTRRALSFLDFPKGRDLHIADLGCGNGAQTLILARHLRGSITAVDLAGPLLAELEGKARQHGLANCLQTLEASIDALPLAPESLDLIWSEGAIYNLGFEQGLAQWRPLIKPGGYLAVSEITWLTASRPQEIDAFWRQAYPHIATAGIKIQQLERLGYTLKGYFPLNPSSWLTSYYQPLADRFADFLDRHQHTELARKVVQEQQTEIDLYQRYQGYYSYGFYVAQKPDLLR